MNDHTYNSSTWESREGNGREFKASLGYKVSSRKAWGKTWDHALKQQEEYLSAHLPALPLQEKKN